MIYCLAYNACLQNKCLPCALCLQQYLQVTISKAFCADIHRHITLIEIFEYTIKYTAGEERPQMSPYCTYKYLPCESESSDEDVLECALRSFFLFGY